MERCELRSSAREESRRRGRRYASSTLSAPRVRAPASAGPVVLAELAEKLADISFAEAPDEVTGFVLGLLRPQSFLIILVV